MGLPGRKDVEAPGFGQYVVGHSRAEALNVPLLWAMETELPIEAFTADLRRHLQKNHPGKAAAVGVGWVVVTGLLAVEPNIHHAQLIPPRCPWTAPLGRLFVDHMADPAFATGQQNAAA